MSIKHDTHTSSFFLQEHSKAEPEAPEAFLFALLLPSVIKANLKYSLVQINTVFCFNQLKFWMKGMCSLLAILCSADII